MSYPVRWTRDPTLHGGSSIRSLAGWSTAMSSILVLREWPLSGLWAIAKLFGVNLLFAGFSMISIGSAAKRVTRAVA